MKVWGTLFWNTFYNHYRLIIKWSSDRFSSLLELIHHCSIWCFNKRRIKYLTSICISNYVFQAFSIQTYRVYFHLLVPETLFPFNFEIKLKLSSHCLPIHRRCALRNIFLWSLLFLRTKTFQYGRYFYPQALID